MSSKQTLKSPPGLSNQEAEIFWNGSDLMVDFDQQRYYWKDAPKEVITWLQNLLLVDQKALKLLAKAGITEVEDALFTYAKCRFGGFNLDADLKACGSDTGSEVWECGCNGGCALSPLFRQNMQAENGVLKAREIEITRHLAHGKSGREIAASMFISEDAVNKAKQNIFYKTATNNSSSLVHWATAKNLV